MVSPRKRVLQATHHQVPGTTPRTKPTPFVAFRFFLDLKSKGEKTRISLIEDIKALGGQLEEFFDKSVTHLITDCPDDRLPLSSSKPVPSAGPPSPWTPTPSPTTSASPASARRPVTSSRTEAILAKVKTSSKAIDPILERAVQLGIQIWSLTKTLAWLAKFRAKYGSLNQSRSSDQRARSVAKGVRSLVSPCLKLESATHSTRPVFAELKAWPILHFDGRPGASPFSASSAKQKTKKLARRLDIKRDQSNQVKKKEETHTKVRKTGGFCEICNTSYSDLDRHLLTDLHTGFVGTAENWFELDQLVANSCNNLL